MTSKLHLGLGTRKEEKQVLPSLGRPIPIQAKALLLDPFRIRLKTRDRSGRLVGCVLEMGTDTNTNTNRTKIKTQEELACVGMGGKCLRQCLGHLGGESKHQEKRKKRKGD